MDMAFERPGARQQAPLTQAFSLAAKLHGAQFRKGTTVPYLSHLLSVAALVMEYGGDQEQTIAALLHDAVEDCGAEHLPVIRHCFGARVARIVNDCTDAVASPSGRKADWKPRKLAYLGRLAKVEPDTLLVSGCDKLHNARSTVRDLRHVGPAVFARFTAGKEETLWYYREVSGIFLERLPGPLSNELARTVSTLVREAAAA